MTSGSLQDPTGPAEHEGGLYPAVAEHEGGLYPAVES